MSASQAEGGAPRQMKSKYRLQNSLSTKSVHSVTYFNFRANGKLEEVEENALFYAFFRINRRINRSSSGTVNGYSFGLTSCS